MTTLASLTNDELVTRLGLGDDGPVTEEIIRRVYAANSMDAFTDEYLGTLFHECSECGSDEHVDVIRSEIQP